MPHRLLAAAGYRLLRVPPGFDPDRGFTLFSYLDEDGKFDYARYRAVQIAGNKRKIREAWAREENIAFLASYLQAKIGTVCFGICHGTRNGAEQRWFAERLSCEVIGTEISETASEFAMTLQWDFHEPNPDWEGRADFVYSNSLDHAYDPEKAINTWAEQLRPNGLMLIEHSNCDDLLGANTLDPFGADIVQMPYLIAVWGGGRYAVREILPLPDRDRRLRYLDALVVQKFV